MDNKQKLQMLQAKFVNNYNIKPKIKEGFVGGGYKTFLQAESDNMLKHTKLVDERGIVGERSIVGERNIVKDEFIVNKSLLNQLKTK